MPWSVFDYGRDSVLDPVIAAIADPEARKAVEHDRDTLYADPRNHDLPVTEWKGDDDVPWPTSIVILGSRVAVRYAVITNYPQPAVVAAQDLGPLLQPG